MLYGPGGRYSVRRRSAAMRAAIRAGRAYTVRPYRTRAQKMRRLTNIFWSIRYKRRMPRSRLKMY